jgi:hypothetical protein
MRDLTFDLVTFSPIISVSSVGDCYHLNSSGSFMSRDVYHGPFDMGLGEKDLE